VTCAKSDLRRSSVLAWILSDRSNQVQPTLVSRQLHKCTTQRQSRHCATPARLCKFYITCGLRDKFWSSGSSYSYTTPVHWLGTASGSQLDLMQTQFNHVFYSYDSGEGRIYFKAGRTLKDKKFDAKFKFFWTY
jgi:hypothetical protein